MNRIQLVDLDTSSEEVTGGVVILRQEMQSRLGWLNTKGETHLKQEMETMEIVKEVDEIPEEAQTQATQEHQPSHTLASTDTLKAMDILKDECEKESREQKKCCRKARTSTAHCNRS